MTGKIKAVERSNAHSVDVGDSSDSGSESEDMAGAFDEGRTETQPSAAESADAREALTPLCPTPVRIVVGVFSSLVAIGGCTMSVIGFHGLQDPADADYLLHRGLLGGGLALLTSGAMGIASTFVQRRPTPAPAALA